MQYYYLISILLVFGISCLWQDEIDGNFIGVMIVIAIFWPLLLFVILVFAAFSWPVFLIRYLKRKKE